MIKQFDIKEDVKISNNGGFFCQACICGRPLTQRSKDERYCLECYDVLKGEYGTSVPIKIKEEKKVKKQEALDLVTKLGESYETRSNDGYYDVVEKTTGKKVTDIPLAKVKPGEFRGLPVVKGKTVTFIESPITEEPPKTNGKSTKSEVTILKAKHTYPPAAEALAKELHIEHVKLTNIIAEVSKLVGWSIPRPTVMRWLYLKR